MKTFVINCSAGPQDENFDPSHLAPLSADSPVSITDESHPHGCGAGGTFGMIEGDGDKRPGLDELLSKEALKIDGSLDQIFEDSEEEEEEGPSVSNRGLIYKLTCCLTTTVGSDSP